ncbi:hypothetical protein [Paenibacillus koleovorans]|uniref:hypothetical protein n=1 Tax=Paenibacillus koleovorans TaxID=121608 RepID=UPI000FD82AF9|nr:hypothetical protein [Paenibacillus koleovorans]
MTTESLQHARNIARMQQMDPARIASAKLEGLLQGVRDGTLSKDDVLQYTNMAAEQLEELLQP